MRRLCRRRSSQLVGRAMNEAAARAISDPHDRRHVFIRRVLEEPQINRFAFTRAEIAERLRHLGVAEPSFSLTLGVELRFWAQRDSTPPRPSAMVLAHQVEHDAVQPASKFGHLPRGTAAYECP